MIKQALRPYLTTGVAVVGAAIVAVVPAAPQPPAPQPAQTGQHAVALASETTILQGDGILVDWIPEVTVAFDGLPAQIDVDIPQNLGFLLALIGPFMTAFDALQHGDDFFQGFLYGQSGIDLFGLTIPLFNGLLVDHHAVDLSFGLGDLVGTFGFGDQTLGGLLDGFGIGDTPVADLVGSLLGTFGLGGNPTITDLADQFGFGDQSLGSLAGGLLETLGIGNPTVGGLIDETGLADQSIASVLIGLLGNFGISGDPTIAGLLEDQLGFGDQSVAELAASLLDVAGLGNPTVSDLLGGFLPGDITLGDAVKELLGSVAPGDPTITDLVDQLGGDQSIGGLLTGLLGGAGFGDQNVAELIEQLLGEQLNVGANITLGDLVIDLLNEMGYDMTLSEVLDSAEMSDQTLGELLAADPEMANAPFKQFLSDAGVGDQTLQQLGGLSNFECTFAPIAGIDCSTTLNGLMGNNSLLETLQNLHSDGAPDLGVAHGTPLADVTLGQLLAATGEGDEKLSEIITGLNLSTPLDQLLTSLGLDTVTVNQILEDGFPGLFGTSLSSVLASWGLNNLDLDTVIDRLGLDMTLTDMLDKLGLNNLDIDTLLDRLLGDVQVGTVLGDLGLDDVHIEAFINNLLGDTKVGDLLDGLDLDNVDLDTVLDHLLGGVTVDDVLDDLDIGSVHLDSLLSDLLGDATVGTLLGDLGISGTDVDTLLSNLGIDDTDVATVHIGDFFGLFGGSAGSAASDADWWSELAAGFDSWWSELTTDFNDWATSLF